MQEEISRVTGGRKMTEDKSLEQFLQEMVEKEQERHEKFLKEHLELMQMIENARKGMQKDE